MTFAQSRFALILTLFCSVASFSDGYILRGGRTVNWFRQQPLLSEPASTTARYL